MKIVADENIPHVQHYFGTGNECIFKPGRTITRQDVLNADILLVRAVTSVNKALLHNTSIKFVGSTTIGMDHLDIDWLNSQGIEWAVATNCNAIAVVEYVIAIIASLQKQGLLLHSGLRAGVIGVGNIGKQVAKKLKLFGFEVIECDPLRAQAEKDFHSTALDNFSDLDFITLHTPLTFLGEYPTYHMIEKNFLQRQKPGCILLNTGRGAVIHSNDLKKYGTHLRWCLDVFENEPEIDLEILQSAFLATPHIAGYSIQSKYRGIEMIYQAALQKKILQGNNVPALEFPTRTLSFNNTLVNWRDIVLKIYDPMQTFLHMKKALLNQQECFDDLRKNFQDRCEFQYVHLENVRMEEKDERMWRLLLGEGF